MPCSVQFSPDKCVMNPPTIHDYILTYKQNLHTRMATLVVLISVIISLSSVLGLETYTVGAMIDTCEGVPCNENKEIAFRLGIEFFNRKLERSGDFKLRLICQNAEQNNPLNSIKVTCSMLSIGVVGIFGPISKETARAVQSVCDAKEVPLVETNYEIKREPGVHVPNLHPHWDLLSKIYSDLVQAWGWTKFTILYENIEGLYRMKELLKLYNSTGPTVVIRQLDKSNSGNYRLTLMDALLAGETHFVLDTSIDSLDEVLRQAQQVGLITSRYNFIITNLDMQTIDLTSYQFGRTNITGIGFIDPFNHHVVKAADELQEMRLSAGLPKQGLGLFSSKLRMDTALTIDSVTLFGRALREVRQFHNFSASSVTCDSTDTWKFGENILAYMKSDVFQGLTGRVKFNSKGKRTDFSVNILELREGGLTKIGIWNSTEGLQIHRLEPHRNAAPASSLVNRTLVVITALTEPYAIRRKSSVPLKGNDEFEGFGIDVIDELAKLEGFNYILKIREDKANGDVDPKTGKWSGMIGDVQSGVADLAIADLTITDEREEAVDFTPPFMSLGISIIYQKPKKAPPSFFSFADPFAPEVWLMLMASSLAVAVSMFVMGRLCQGEWTNPYPCVEEPKYLVNQWSMQNSVWFVVGSLMQQGSEVAPIAAPPRFAACVWTFFVLIMVSCYTANLAAFLTTENADTHFSNVKELADRSEKLGIRYGAKGGGATIKFFKAGAKINSDYKKIYDHMTSNPKDNPGDNDIGIKWAEESKYALFMESSSIEYNVERHCNLQQVGGKLDQKGYGIAMQKHAPYRHLLSTAVLNLQQQGVIYRLKRKWWEERGALCLGASEESSAPPLYFKNISGIFGVTVGGTILAMILVVIEMLMDVHTRAKEEKLSFCGELWRELAFFLKFREMVKPVRRRAPVCSISSNLINVEENGRTKEGSRH